MKANVLDFVSRDTRTAVEETLDKGKFHVRARQCDTCIYRETTPDGRPLKWDIEKLEQAIQSHYEGYFDDYRICHHENHDSRRVCCRGFWNRHRDDFMVGQVAQRLDMVREVSGTNGVRGEGRRKELE